MDINQSTSASTTSNLAFQNMVALSATQWMQEIPTLYLVFLIFSTLATAVVIVVAFIHLYNIHYHIPTECVQTDLYTLALLFPIVGLASLLGMYLIRSATFLTVIAHTYLMYCLLALVSLHRHIFGGREMMCRYLLSQQEFVKFNTPPFCCCCKCLPALKPTVKTLRRIEWSILQSPIVRILAEIVKTIAFFEQTSFSRVALVANVVEVISMMSAFYGCNILINLGQEKQAPYRTRVIFQCVNMTQLFLALQMFIFNLVGQFHGFVSSSLMSANSKSMYWNSTCLTIEMCLLSLVATVLLSRDKMHFFNKSNRQVKQNDSGYVNRSLEDVV